METLDDSDPLALEWFQVLDEMEAQDELKALDSLPSLQD